MAAFTCERENSKFEYRNSKELRKSQEQMTQELFRILKFEFVSDFEFRA